MQHESCVALSVCIHFIFCVMVLPCGFQFNFVGKLLGPKGNSMKRLQEETMTKMAVLGRGSMRDKQKVSTKCYEISKKDE